MTVEKRLQKLEGMNQRLNEQNQQLTDELKTVTQKVNAASPGMPIGQSDGTIQGFGMRLAMDF